MAGERERYLRQQIELGGSEVILDQLSSLAMPANHAQPKSNTAERGPLARAQQSVVESEEMEHSNKRGEFLKPEPEPTRVAAEPPSRWRKDAPPIPGPGLTITLPPESPLARQLASLKSLDAVAELIRPCTLCALSQTRTQTVPGEGNPTADLMCIGEGPGATEDETGRPFVGAAGQLLDQILGAIDCPRSTVYIANIVKCRPPGNRKPLPDEATSCLPYLHRQIALVRPKVLLALGGTAAEWLLGTKQSLGNLRGKVHDFAGIPLVVTYHPAALLRNPNWKKPTWDDVRIARQLLDR